MITYKSYLDEVGMPVVAHGIDLSIYFTKEYYQRRLPIWQHLDEAGTLGAPGVRSGFNPETKTTLMNLVGGFIGGILIYLLITRRRNALAAVTSAMTRIKGLKGGKTNG